MIAILGWNLLLIFSKSNLLFDMVGIRKYDL